MTEPSASTNGLKFINLWQSAEERREKYWLGISLGASSAQSRRMRDWRLSKIERFFNLQPDGIIEYNPENSHNRLLAAVS